LTDKVPRKNRIKKFRRLLLNAILVLLFIPFALTFLFRDPMVQTISAKMLTSLLSAKAGVRAEVQSLKVNIFNGIEIKGLLLDDYRNNPMIRVKHLKAKPVFADRGLFGILFQNVELDGAEFTYKRYKGETDFNFTYFLKLFSDTTQESSGSFKLKSHHLKLTASMFHLVDENKAYNNGKAMDYAGILLASVNLEGTNFKIINDSLNFKIDQLTVREQCGINIHKMSADFIMSSSGLHAKGLLMEIAQSSLDLDLDFSYSSYKSFGFFIDSVEMEGDFRPTILQMDDLGYFAEIMFQMPNKIGLTGKVKGPVSNLRGENLMIHFGKNTHVAADASIKGLPDFFASYMEADFKEVAASVCDFKNFFLPIEEQHVDLSEQIECEEVFHLSGDFKGYYEDFVSNIKIGSNEGAVDAHIAFTNIENDTLYFKLSLKGDTVNVGHLMHQEQLLGQMNLDVKLSGQGNTMDNLFMEGEGMLTAVDFLDYKYQRIHFRGRYFQDSLFGNVRIGDKHLMLNADAFLHFGQTPFVGVKTHIVKADLHALKLVPIPGFGLSGHANLLLKGFNPETMTGFLTLKNSKLWFEQSVYDMDSLSLVKDVDTDSLHSISLYSDFADFSMEGKYNIETIPERINELINHFLRIEDGEFESQPPGEDYVTFEGEIKNSEIIKKEFISGLAFSAATTFNGKLDFENNIVQGGMNSGEIIYKGIVFNDNSLNIRTENDRVIAIFKNARIIIKDSTENDKTVFGIDNLELKANVGSDSLSYGIYWDNKDSLLINYGNLEGYLTADTSAMLFVVSKSDLMINDTAWQIAENNSIKKNSLGTTFNNIEISGGNSRLFINGRFPHYPNDSLQLVFQDWSLSNFDMITLPMNFNLGGQANGFLEFSLVEEKPAIISDLSIRNFHLNNELLGNVHMMNTWDNINNSIFVKMQILKEGSSGKGEILSVDGYYYPFNKQESFDLAIDFNRFKIRSLESFVSAYLSQIEGVANGHLMLKGSVDNPQLTGKVGLQRTSLLVNYLNTKYSFSNDVEFKTDEIVFDNLVIYDTLGNKAEIVGSLRHNHFKDPRFDVKITTDKLLFFNTDRHMNSLYYGTAITSGDIFISGSPQDIALKIKVASKKGTHVYLPMDYTVEIADKNYIIFASHEPDSLEFEEEKEIEEKEDNKLKYDIKLNMKVTPEAKVTISLPGDMGSIESEGTGELRMHTNTKGDFTLIGDYTVSQGLFHFSIGNLVNKRFELVKGGRISWTGDPYLANLSIKGLYKVKTNLSSLGIQIDSTANYKNKVNVECYVILTNQLLNPDLRFEILFPDLDPDLQRMVYASMDTTNQAVVNQQMISLLVLGTFSFNNASNVGLNTAYYSVLTNQLSSMLSRISDDFDIGVNYRPGDEITQQEFDVALSTQLFDDRLTIDGNFGMTYDRSHQSASNIVGDVDIGYKLTEDGQWVLKVFNHSNVNSWYNYSNYDKVSPYTQGVGIAFRKEFNKFAELFQRTRPKKEKKKKSGSK
jgi:hypothetical protein